MKFKALEKVFIKEIDKIQDLYINITQHGIICVREYQGNVSFKIARVYENETKLRYAIVRKTKYDTTIKNIINNINKKNYVD